MIPKNKNSSSLTSYAWLSVAAAIITISLKSYAYFLTGSVGILSDALESLVNLASALLALAMLTIAARPPDDEHTYGHNKAEYFSSGVEGMLILVASIGIIYTAVPRLINPKPLEQVGFGLAVSAIASLVNLFAALKLRKAGRQFNSITLEADSKHLMTDVWTSAGVLVGVGAVVLTGWDRFDPIIAILVAVNINWTGFQIIRKSVLGLMDTALPLKEQNSLRKILEYHCQKGIQYHALRTRQSGTRQFASFHILVPGIWTVSRGHQLIENIEADIHHAFPNISLFTHLESLDDSSSWDDVDLDRKKIP